LFDKHLPALATYFLTHSQQLSGHPIFDDPHLIEIAS
jgi:hypothetical protein